MTDESMQCVCAHEGRGNFLGWSHENFCFNTFDLNNHCHINWRNANLPRVALYNATSSMYKKSSRCRDCVKCFEVARCRVVSIQQKNSR